MHCFVNEEGGGKLKIKLIYLYIKITLYNNVFDAE